MEVNITPNFEKLKSFYESLMLDESFKNLYLYGYPTKISYGFHDELSRFLYDQHQFEPHYPKGAKYIVVLTHDVDNIYPSLGMIKFYFNKNPFKSVDLLIGRIRGLRRPFLNLNKILEREMEYNTSSTYFILSSKKDVLPFYRPYIYDPIVKQELKKLSRKTEIGLHLGYYSYNNLEMMKNEKKILEKVIGQKIYGVRNHYLNLILPSTWEKQSEAGFLYDSTWGYKYGYGYKNGICYPFIPYNPKDNRWIKIFVLPLTVMDRGLIKARIDPEKFFDKYKRFIEGKAIKYGCFITLLWHNDLLFDPRFKRYSELYWKLLKHTLENEGILVPAIKSINIWVEQILKHY